MMGSPVSEKLSNFYFILLSSYLCFHFYSLELFLPELTFSCKLHWFFFSSIYLTKKSFFSVYDQPITAQKLKVLTQTWSRSAEVHKRKWFKWQDVFVRRAGVCVCVCVSETADWPGIDGVNMPFWGQRLEEDDLTLVQLSDRQHSQSHSHNHCLQTNYSRTHTHTHTHTRSLWVSMCVSTSDTEWSLLNPLFIS